MCHFSKTFLPFYLLFSKIIKMKYIYFFIPFPMVFLVWSLYFSLLGTLVSFLPLSFCPVFFLSVPLFSQNFPYTKNVCIKSISPVCSSRAVSLCCCAMSRPINWRAWSPRLASSVAPPLRTASSFWPRPQAPPLETESPFSTTQVTMVTTMKF